MSAAHDATGVRRLAAENMVDFALDRLRTTAAYINDARRAMNDGMYDRADIILGLCYDCLVVECEIIEHGRQMLTGADRSD